MEQWKSHKETTDLSEDNIFGFEMLKNYIWKEDEGMCVDIRSLKPIYLPEMEQAHASGFSSRFVKIFFWPTYDETI